MFLVAAHWKGPRITFSRTHIACVYACVLNLSKANLNDHDDAAASSSASMATIIAENEVP